MMTSKTLLLTVFATFIFFSFSSAFTVYDIVQENPSFSNLKTILNSSPQLASIVDLLKNTTTNTTIFAPNNVALPSDTVNITADTLAYHLVDGTALLQDGAVFETHYASAALNGENQRVVVTADGDSFKVNAAHVNTTQTNTTSENGIFYGVDAVIMPPQSNVAELVAATQDLSTLLDLIQRADVANTFANFTITAFAPNNAAFDAIKDNAVFKYLASNSTMANKDLAAVLKYHASTDLFYDYDVANGNLTLPTVEGTTLSLATVNKTTTVNGASIVTPNVLASNGVAHVIDSVLLPGDLNITLEKYMVGLGLNSLLTALEANGLGDLLNGSAPFTIFAPTDAAIAAATGNITKDRLLYHVVSGRTLSSDLSNGELLQTQSVVDTLLNKGQMVKITIGGGNQSETVRVNNAKITDADNQATNGVIHVIDSVLSLPGNLVTVLSADNKNFSTLVDFASKFPEVVKMLTTDGDLTLLAPSNAAFKALPAPVRGYLALPNQTEPLLSVLQYHVLPNAVDYSADLKKKAPTNVTTAVANETVEVVVVNGTLYFNGNPADKYESDLLASTGVAQGLTAVLIPSSLVIDAEGLLKGLHDTTLLTLLNQTGLLTELTPPFTLFAPNDHAFAEMKNQALLNTNKSKDALINLLKTHVIGQGISSLKANHSYATLASNKTYIHISEKDGDLYATVNGSSTAPYKIYMDESSSTINVKPVSYIYSVHGVLGQKEKKKTDDKGLSSTIIGLIVAGCIVGVLLVGAAIGGGVWYYKKRHGYEQIEGDTF